MTRIADACSRGWAMWAAGMRMRRVLPRMRMQEGCKGSINRMQCGGCRRLQEGTSDGGRGVRGGRV